MQTIKIEPSQVRQGRRVRSDMGDVEGLAKSIRELGQLQNIVVTPSKHEGRFDLVAGARRLKACTKLGIEVQADVITVQQAMTRLDMELAENMRRKDLDLAEQSEAHARRKALYERLHPEVKHGAKLKRGKAQAPKAEASKAEPAKRYTLLASEALGCSERKVQELLEIQKLPQDDLSKVLKGCKTSAERNKACQELLRQARAKRKEEKLAQQAEASRQRTIEDVDRPKVVLHHGDCLDLMVGEETTALICTDPPYDRERSLIGHVSRAAINQDVEWDKLDMGWVVKAAPLLAPGGQLLAFCPLEAVGSYEAVIQAAGLEYRMALIWCKTNPGAAHRPTYVHGTEAIVWAVKPGAKPFFQPWESQQGGESLNWVSGPICQGSERLDHPTQKPLWLIKRLIHRHSQEGDQVLDPFAGVATTGVACMELKRGATLIERDDKYVKLARMRLEASR